MFSAPTRSYPSIQGSEKVHIEVRTFMKFREFLPPASSDGKAHVSLKDGATFADLLHTLGIPSEEPKLVIINGISRGVVSDTFNTEILHDGDVVAIFPPAGGG
jgi:sulfur carrier protein ThiS